MVWDGNQPSIEPCLFNYLGLYFIIRVGKTRENKPMIRRARKEDMESIYSLLCDLEEKILDKNKFTKIFLTYLRSNHRRLLVFENSGEVIGVLNLRMEYQLHHCVKIAEIMEFCIKKEFRSKGIGRTLFRAACQQAKNDGCLQIEVCCNQLRTKAHHFYQREGMHKFHYKFSMNL
jgi:PhnO protein